MYLQLPCKRSFAVRILYKVKWTGFTAVHCIILALFSCAAALLQKFQSQSEIFLLCTLFQKPHLVNDLGNFEPRNVAERTGPGEGGKPHILRDEQQNDASQTLTEFGMNMVCSDEISMSRSIPDTRLPE